MQIASLRRIGPFEGGVFQLLLFSMGVAYRPVIAWYLARVTDLSDEPWGLISLLMLAAFLIRERNQRNVEPIREVEALTANIPTLLGISSIAVAYGLTFSASPPLVRSLFLIAALALVANRILPRDVSRIGYVQLLILSLPLLPSLEFYCGYPFRALNAQVLAFGFRLVGWPVEASGATLRYESIKIFIDAPCSGIKMCWTTWFLLACVLCGLRLGKRQTLFLCLICAPLLFFANLARTAFLFSLEVFVPNYPKGLHEGIGILCFLWIALIILRLGFLLKAKCNTKATQTSLHALPLLRSRSTFFRKFESVRIAILICLLAHGFALAMTQRLQSVQLTGTKLPELHWPQEFLGEKLEQIPLTGREEVFLRDFPGTVRRFRSTKDEVVVRAVYAATRKLHPVSDCLRGQGYLVEPAPAYQTSEYGLMNCTLARDQSAQFRVCEIIVDDKGGSWTDVSEWYWAATLGTSRGPWYAVSISDKNAASS